MADNMCGPSTALKSFSEHVNRDRSVHQDRTAPGRAGPANFRSTPMGNHSNEAEVRAFTSGAQSAFQAEPMGMPHEMNGHVHPAAFQQMGPQMGTPQARFAGPGAAPNANWAAEFAASPAALSSAAPQAHQPFVPQQPLQAVNQRLQHFSSGMMAPAPAFVSMAQPNFSNHTMYNGYTSMTSSYAPPAANFHATSSTTTATTTQTTRPGDAPSGVAGLTEAELEARFAQMETELDFQGEMDSWMQAHGPTTAERAEAQTEDVDAILESLADELDAQRLAESEATAAEAEAAPAQPTEEEVAREAEKRDQDDLARTAGQIINTLDAHPNARFQESSFLRLMRRIHTREVTVKGEDLVDEATGLPINGSSQDGPTSAEDPSGQETPNQAAA
ncbi:hypothetical protein SEUCBS139899_005423 [Sporothrix eucalyptigena]|uniref:Peroxin 20 n=1 Tax=Sporothrix eucalyptigena TaxID=1812306 RepID=A0ABP0CPF8_9PEZI